MERLRHKRSKSAGSADRRSSGFGFVFSNAEAPHQPGNKQSQKQRNAHRLAADSSSCSSRIPAQDDDLVTFELGHNSTRRAFGTPIKKLLAEEMVKESESKRRSPSIIARLMGLDGLPAQQQSAHKQQKGFLVNNNQQRTAPIESHRNAVSYEGSHRRKNSKEQQEFKDVFEVVETLKVDGSSVPLQRPENGRCTEAKIDYIWQKFMDAKRLSTDEKLQDSKEFHDALEVLDSNKDLLLKFLQEPDSLFTKHLHDLRGSPQQSHCTNIAVIRSGNALKYGKRVKESKSGRGSSWRGDKRSLQQHPDGALSQSYSRHDIHSSVKSKVWSEAKDETRILPTRIVVLKPNVGKLKDAIKSVSSPHTSNDFHSAYRKQMELPNIRHREADLWEKENLCNDLKPSRYKSRESRVIAKEITGRMKNGFNSGSNMSPSYKRGYAGDESSSSMSGNDSANESEAETSTSRNFFDCDNRYGLSSSNATESSVNREAKKKLSERWQMTRRFLDVGVVNRGSTLGEMLSDPDRDMPKKGSNVIIGQEDSNSNGKIVGLAGPFGISSRDGWKNEYISNISRSRSLPASSAAFGSPQASMPRGYIMDDRRMLPTESIAQGRNKAVQMNFNQRDVSCRNLRSGHKKSRSPRRAYEDSSGTLGDTYFRQNQVHCDAEHKGSDKQESIVPERSTSIVTATDSSLDDATNAGHENMTVSSEIRDNYLQEVPESMAVKAKSSSGAVDNPLPQELSVEQSEQDSVVLHCPVLGSESPASSKDIDQPSPVSVLEVPFVEDPSSGCECFEKVSADIQGLRMQLQLLKLESDSYTEGPMLISSDEEDGVLEEHAMRAQESWQSQYLVDALNHFRFDDANPDMFMDSYSECPISPRVFQELENKYCNQNSCSRCERKFLFDRINSALIEILRLFMDPHPWVKAATRIIHGKWDRVEVEDELCKFLAGQERKQGSDIDIIEKVLGKDSQWLNLRGDLDVIGREVESLLMDELVAEVVSTWRF